MRLAKTQGDAAEPVASPSPADLEQLATLAHQLECFTESELCRLSGNSPATIVSWREKKQGPPYILFGRNYFYPIEAVREHFDSLVKRRVQPPAAGQL